MEKAAGKTRHTISKEKLDRIKHAAEIKMKEQERVLITIDGPCASGKTMLADMLSEKLHATVIHTDDYVVPHAQKTAERLAVPGGNCDQERLIKEFLNPWKKGEKATIIRYDCHNDRFSRPEVLENNRIIILEGCYCNLPEIRKCADIRLFVNTPESVRMERLMKRESPESMAMFTDRWIPLENAYISAYGLPDPGCILI